MIITQKAFPLNQQLKRKETNTRLKGKAKFPPPFNAIQDQQQDIKIDSVKSFLSTQLDVMIN